MSAAVTPKQYEINRLIWRWVIALLAFDLALAWWLGVGFDTAPLPMVGLVLMLIFSLSIFYRYVRRDEMLCLLGQVTNQIIFAVGALGILNYLTTRLNLPLVDEQLIAIDRALSFDWHSYIWWINENPLLSFVLTLAYMSSGPQIFLVCMALFLCRQSAEVQRFILIFFISGFVTIILAMLFPAVAGYVHYNVDISQYVNLHPAAQRIHEEHYMAMRNHTTDVLPFPLRGLVTFPSFHSTMAVVMMYAAWPVRWLRLIIVPLNVLVLMSVPVDGGHYLIDVIGGVAIALGAIYLVNKKLFPRGA